MVQSYRIFFERWARGFLVAAMISAIAGMLSQNIIFYVIAIVALLLSFGIFAKSRKYSEGE